MSGSRDDGSSPPCGGGDAANPDGDDRLAVYGSLAPGRRNHHRLAHLSGRWLRGTVRGHLLDRGWGAGVGFPGLVPDDDGPRVPVEVLESPELARAWPDLDAFEGEEYRRVEIVVDTEDRVRVRAWIYALESAEASRREGSP